MTIILWILIIIGFVNESFAKDLKIYIYKNKITAVESFVNETSITVKCKVNTRDNPCEWTPKVTFTFPKDIQKPFLQLKMSDLDTSVSIVDHTMLVCSLKATLGLDMIMKIIWEQISKYMDLIIKCPLDAFFLYHIGITYSKKLSSVRIEDVVFFSSKKPAVRIKHYC
ncbi:hypothetical protein ACKWTF_016691 [Chironomus riparius]